MTESVYLMYFLIEIHSLQDWPATKWHGLTRERRCENEKHKKVDYKKLKVERCLLFLELRPYRSSDKGKHLGAKEFQSLAAWVKKLFP